MTDKLLIFFCLFFAFYACQESTNMNKKTARVWINPDIKLEEGLIIKFSLTVLKDDEFKIYYEEDYNKDFNEEKTIKTKVKGTNDEQLITYRFPSGVKPTKLRVDFGFNQNQIDFKINKLELYYKNKHLIVPAEALMDYFEIFDKRLIFDLPTKTLTVNKNIKRNQYLPTIISNSLLKSELDVFFEKNSEMGTEKIEFSSEHLVKLASYQTIRQSIESFESINNIFRAKGWAILENVDSKNTKLTVLLLNEQTGYVIESINKKRPDVTNFFKLEYNADHSGFEINASLSHLPRGNYKLGIWLNNQTENEEALIITKKEISLQ